MEAITSVQNTLIKEAKKLQLKKHREKTGHFLLEGIRLVEEALNAGKLDRVFFSKTLLESERGLQLYHNIENSKLVKIYDVSNEVLRILAETETPQGIVGVSSRAEYSLADITDMGDGIILTTDGIQDPGNLGTMIRTAWAAGVKAVICLQGTVDPYNGKTVRASMGGIFYIPVLTGIEWDEFLAWARAQGFFLVAAESEGSDSYFRVTYKPKTVLIIGNEGSGLQTVDIDDLDNRVRIPLEAGAESLNAGIACGIILFEIRKQLKNKQPNL